MILFPSFVLKFLYLLKLNIKGASMDIIKLAKKEPIGLGKEEVMVEGAVFVLDTLGRVKVRISSIPKNAPRGLEYQKGGEFWARAEKLLKGRR